MGSGGFTKVSCTSGPNLVFLAWTGDELSRKHIYDWYTDIGTHRHRQQQNPKAKTGLRYK